MSCLDGMARLHRVLMALWTFTVVGFARIANQQIGCLDQRVDIPGTEAGVREYIVPPG